MRVVPVVLLLAVCAADSPAAADTIYVRGPAAAVAVAPAAIDHRVILIGDAGAPDPDGEPALIALRRHAAALPERTTVVFLGDNVYETGMPDASALEGTVMAEILDQALLNLYESRTDAERRIDAQIAAVEQAGARAVFVPGNHDWDQFGVGGWQRLLQFEAYLARVQARVATPLLVRPAGGCPGPAALDLGAGARLITLDTQWWLDAGLGGKPGLDRNTTGCRHLTEDAVVAGLERELEAACAAGDEVIVAAHHPLRTRGPHGGYAPALVHLFPLRILASYVPAVLHWTPLPVLGSTIVGVRRFASPSVQDLSNPTNRHMRRRLRAAMARAPADGCAPLLYAAGHDHSLQVFAERRPGPRFTVVSGLGSSQKASPVGHEARTLFAHSDPAHPGFVTVDFLRDGRARLAVVEWRSEAEGAGEVYARFLP